MIEANFKIKKYKKQNTKENKRIPLICESILVPISPKKKNLVPISPQKTFWCLYPLKKIYSACILSGRALLSNGRSPYTAAHIILLMI